MTKGIQYQDDYTSTELVKLEEFRQRVSDILTIEDHRDNSFLIRWLRARNLDIGKAEQMLRTSMQWRKDNNVDNILETEDVPEELKRMTPIALCGVTKEGYPCFLCPFGRHDTRATLEKYGVEACQRFNLVNMEKIALLLKAEGERQGRKVTQFVEIMDLEGYSYRQMSSKLCRDFMVEMQTVMDNHYPEVLRHAVIVNAPKVFAVLFALLKPFIPKHTLEKIEILGPDKSKWMKAIKDKFPMEMIPPHWGGTLKGVDEYCTGHEIWIQGPKDLRSFMNGLDESDSDFTSTVINARDKLTKEFQVDSKSTIIEWKFKTENYDIGFQVNLSIDGNNRNFEEIIVPYTRLDSHNSVQEGSYVCQQPGTYKFVFDNSYSLVKPKTLLYNFNIVEPDCDFEECPEF